MGGNTGEIEIGSERELYKYINHQAETTKASIRIILLVQMYNIFRLLINSRLCELRIDYLMKDG